MRFGIVALIYLVGAGVSMLSMAAASSLFLWNNIFQPLSFAKREGEYPVAYFVLAVLIAAYAVNLARGKFKPNFGAYFACVSAMIGWLLVTTAVSSYPAPAWEEFIRLMKYLLPLLFI